MGIGALGLAAWGGFVLYATNLERASAAVTRQVLATVQRHAQIKELMGDGIQVEESPWLSWASVFGGKGLGWISGSVRLHVKLVRVTVILTTSYPLKVNLPAGHVDISFRVCGPTGAGTVYFTSVRKDKGIPFTIRTSSYKRLSLSLTSVNSTL